MEKQMIKKLCKKIVYKGILQVKTGLHIGAEKNTVEIGGIDSPIVRCVLKDREPYIPGSSLKGKLRSLLQFAYGEAEDKQTGSPICQLFGAADNNLSNDKYNSLRADYKDYLEKNKLISSDNEKHKLKLLGHRSRLVVRDAYLTENSRNQLKNANDSGFTDMPYTEVKNENRIDRIQGKAEHPRQLERIPAGTEFDVEFIIHIYENDDEQKLEETFKYALELLNNDYLGGSGTRGYGQVEIDIDHLIMNKRYIDINNLIKTAHS